MQNIHQKTYEDDVGQDLQNTQLNTYNLQPPPQRFPRRVIPTKLPSIYYQFFIILSVYLQNIDNIAYHNNNQRIRAIYKLWLSFKQDNKNNLIKLTKFTSLKQKNTYLNAYIQQWLHTANIQQILA